MFESLESPIPQLSLDRVSALGAEHFHLTGPATRLGGERDLNVRFDSDGRASTVKVTRVAGDEIPAVIAALRHIQTTDPTLPVPRVIETIDGSPWTTFTVDGAELRLSAFTYLPGRPIPNGPLDPTAARAIGVMLGRLQRALRGFIHPDAVREIAWDARNAAELVPWTDAIPDRNLRLRVEGVLSQGPALKQRLQRLPAQVIHHDFNRNNLLIDPDGDSFEVTGIVDFGDMVHGARVQDLAVATAYAILDHPNPIEPAAALLSGFLEIRTVADDEISVLRDLVAVRLAQSFTISAHRSQLHPDNAEYILIDADRVATAFNQWLNLPAADIDRELRAIAGITEPADSDDLGRRRTATLWSGLRMMYSPPLHIVRGDGVWLEDRAGRRYLDAYNNVAQVGHGNRRVITAAAAQAERLNTNTRYLTDPVVAVAEAITARLPDPLSVCFLVNSGSEASDLAWRIARAATGRSGAITTDHAYHGWTEAIYAISPEERPGDERPAWHRTIPPPHGEGATVDDALQHLGSAGYEPAAIWFDTTFSSDGIADPGATYLDDAVGAVRSAGGLYIADEIQAGLGRVGARYWGFGAGTAVPDIVTLGKPLGNGFPIGAVVTTQEIAERFSDRGYFFSTFGGNPVSAVAALMVLRITDELDLPGRADAVGALLRRELPGILDPIADDIAIRGAGAFIGADVGDASVARAFVDAMRTANVLVSRTGPDGSVVKIRPPLIFDLVNAEQLLEASDAATRTLS